MKMVYVTISHLLHVATKIILPVIWRNHVCCGLHLFHCCITIHKYSSLFFFFVYFVIMTALLCPGKQSKTEIQSFHIYWCIYNIPHLDRDGGREISAMFAPEITRLGPMLTARMRIKLLTCDVVRGHVRAR